MLSVPPHWNIRPPDTQMLGTEVSQATIPRAPKSPRSERRKGHMWKWCGCKIPEGDGALLGSNSYVLKGIKYELGWPLCNAVQPPWACAGQSCASPGVQTVFDSWLRRNYCTGILTYFSMTHDMMLNLKCNIFVCFGMGLHDFWWVTHRRQNG